MTHLAAVPVPAADSPLERYARLLDLAHRLAPTVRLRQLIADVHQDIRALVAAGTSICLDLEQVVSGAVESVITAMEIELAGLR